MVTVVGINSTDNLSWVPEKDAQCGGLLASTQPKLSTFFPSWVFADVPYKLGPFPKSPQICPLMRNKRKNLGRKVAKSHPDRVNS